MNWGNFGPIDYCPPGDVVTSFNVVTDLDDKSVDDYYGLASLKLFCGTGNVMTSLEHDTLTAYMPSPSPVCPMVLGAARQR